MAPWYSGGRNFVSASRVSYMWLSPSKTGNPNRAVIELLLVPVKSAIQTDALIAVDNQMCD
jgi:hypothetical protein